jgi:hypothetical protein
VIADHKSILDRLEEADLITDEEVQTLLDLYRLGYEAGEAKTDAQRAFFKSREIYGKTGR